MSRPGRYFASKESADYIVDDHKAKGRTYSEQSSPQRHASRREIQGRPLVDFLSHAKVNEFKAKGDVDGGVFPTGHMKRRLGTSSTGHMRRFIITNKVHADHGHHLSKDYNENIAANTKDYNICKNDL